MNSDQRRAVFFDRDGVLTEPIWNPATGEYESPHTLGDLLLCDGAVQALQRLVAAGYALFIVSNQPSYAKGKTTLEEIRSIASGVADEFRRGGVVFAEEYYCYHHPRGIVAGYSGPCDCRKPSPYFLLQGADTHGIDLSCSWMVGDRDSDIACGQGAGCRTIMIAHPHSKAHQGTSAPDRVASNVDGAVRYILAESDMRAGVAVY